MAWAGQRVQNWQRDDNGNVRSAPGVLNFAYVGNATSGTATDSDICTRHYAPLDEMSEVEPENLTTFRDRFDNEPGFAQEQYLMQTRMENMTADTTGATTNDYLCFNTSGTSSTVWSQLDYRVPTGDNITWTTTGTGDINWTGNIRLGIDDFSDAGKIRNALMQIFEKVPKSIKKLMTKDEKKLIKAKYKSEKLLRQWLSADEYRSLRLKGELEIPSKENEDEIFIVKKSPHEMVDVKSKKNNMAHKHKLCVVAEDMDYPIGDQLLSKILLLKTDEKEFRRLAIKHG
jgi:hypothetical protein